MIAKYFRRSPSWLGPLLVVGVSAWVVGYLLGAGDRALAVTQSVVAVVALSGSLIVWLWRRWAPGPFSAGNLILPVLDDLAIIVRVQWERSANERRLRYPLPAPVRWRWSSV